MNTTHISFATKNMYGSQQGLKKSAEKFGLKSICYTPESIDPIYVSKFEHIINNFSCRGAGFWLWKPWIILNEMKRLNAGDIIIYTDAGMDFCKDPQPLIDIANEKGKALFEMQVHEVGHFTKRDCFILMGCDFENFHRALFIDAAMQLYKVTDENIKFLEEYQNWCEVFKCINDEKSSLGLELPQYRNDHRHDQSILSNLATKYGIERHRSPSQFSLADKSKYSNSPYDDIFYHHHRRDS